MEITLQEIHVFYSKCFKFSLSGATLRDTFEDLNQKGPKFMIVKTNNSPEFNFWA